MVARNDHTHHQLIAIADPSLCVACGICVGSCNDVAVTLGDTPPVLLWEQLEDSITVYPRFHPLRDVGIEYLLMIFYRSAVFDFVVKL